MTLETASINIDGTVATTGGTATGLISKGQGLNSHVLILDNSAEFVAQQTVAFSTKDPKVNSGSPNGYTQARSSAVLRVPLLLDNGEYTINTMKLELAVDHETTDAEIESMLVTAAQLIHDADFSDFWKKQTVA
jgi:hypothetical protein